MSAETHINTTEQTRPSVPETHTNTKFAEEGIPFEADPKHDVLTQVRQTILGDNIEGFGYNQDGILYIVDSDVKHYTTEPHTKKRAILPSFSRQPGGAHTIEHEPTETEFITVKGYGPEGELHSRVVYEASKFAAHLNNHITENTSADKRITNLRYFEKQAATSAETKKIGIDYNDPKHEYVYDVVQEIIDREGLPNWVGLSWTRDGYKYQVYEDNSRSWKPRNGQRVLREFEVEYRDFEGNVVGQFRRNYKEMRKYLQLMRGLSEDEAVDLHFEVPLEPRPEDFPPSDPLQRWYWEEERAWIGWNAINLPNNSEINRTVGEVLSLDDAAKMLLYGDIHREANDEESEAINELKSNLKERRKIKALQAIVNEVGSEKLWDLADRMLAQYSSTLDKFGIKDKFLEKFGSEETPPADNIIRIESMLLSENMSWIFDEIAKRRYLADRGVAANATALYKGLQVHDPIGRSAEARLTRRDIVNTRIGWAYSHAALYRQMVPAASHEKIVESDRAEGEHGDYREVIKDQLKVQVDRAFTNFLPSVIRARVVEILEKETTQRGKSTTNLTAADYAEIGYLLGYSVGQELIK